MKAVNLLPADRRDAGRGAGVNRVVRQPLLVAAVLVAIVAFTGLGLMANSASSTAASRRTEVSRLEEQIAKLTPAKPVAQVPGAQTVAARQAAVSSVISARISWDNFLWALSRVMPEDVWLLNLSAQATATAATPGATPSSFTLTGYTYSQPAVARLMRRLQLVPWLKDVSLVSSDRTTLGTYSVYQFTLGANFTQIPEVRS